MQSHFLVASIVLQFVCLTACWLCKCLIANYQYFGTLAFCITSGSVTSGLQRPSPLACAMRLFFVVCSIDGQKRQHRPWTVSIDPPTNAEHDAEHVGCFKSSVLRIWESNPA